MESGRGESARGFFNSYEPDTAPIPRCPFVDPHWDEAKIKSALTRAVDGPLASRAADVLSKASRPVKVDRLSVWADERDVDP
jgi:hypothetical protein